MLQYTQGEEFIGLFGPSKNEVALSNENKILKEEVVRLKALLTPEQQKMEFVRQQITKLEESMTDKAKIVNKLF